MKNAFLSFIDYQILEFVANKSIASMKDIQFNFSHLPPEDIEARVRYLCFPYEEQPIDASTHTLQWNNCLLISPDIAEYQIRHWVVPQNARFCISATGLIRLSDSQYLQNRSRRKLWEERFWRFASLIISIMALGVAIASFIRTL